MDKKLKQIGVMAMGLWLMMAVVVAWKWRVLPPELPLLYSLPDGEAQLGTRNSLAVLVGVDLVVAMVNIWLATILYKKDKLAGQFVAWGAVVVNFMLLVTVYKIVMLISA